MTGDVLFPRTPQARHAVIMVFGLIGMLTLTTELSAAQFRVKGHITQSDHDATAAVTQIVPSPTAPPYIQGPTNVLSETNTLGGNSATGLHFPSIPIPPGSHVESAFIRFRFAQNHSIGSINVTVRGQAGIGQPFENSSDPETGGVAERVPLTTAEVIWNFSTGSFDPLSLKGGTIDSPELRDVVQEIIDSPDWERFGGVTIVCLGEGSSAFLAAIDHLTLKGHQPVLHLVYGDPAQPSPTPVTTISAPKACGPPGYVFTMGTQGHYKAIDLTNGATVLSGQVVRPDMVFVNGIFAAARDPLSGSVYLNMRSPSELWRIDNLTTGMATLVGIITPNVYLQAMEFAGGKLLGVTESGDLYEVNISDASVTLITTLPQTTDDPSGTCLAWNPCSETLYRAYYDPSRGGYLQTLDPYTFLVETLHKGIAPMSPAAPSMHAMAVDHHTGHLYFATFEGADYMNFLDPVSGIVQFVGLLDGPIVEAMFFAPDAALPTPTPAPSPTPAPTVTPAPTGVKGERNNGPGGVGTADGLSELSAWYAADRGVIRDGSAVSLWTDLSASGLNAIQINPAARPQVFESVINGMPALDFNIDDELGTDPLSARFANDEISVFVVSRADSIRSTYFLHTQAGYIDDRFTIHLPWGDQRVFFDFGDLTGPGRLIVDAINVDSMGFHSYGFFSDDQTGQRIYEDGGILASDSSGDRLNVAGLPLKIGTNTDGAIAEIAVFNRDLSRARRVIVENYLSAKYDLVLDTAGGAVNIYAGDDPGNGNYDRRMIAIGRESDGSHDQATGDGLILRDFSFLKDNGDYIAAGHAESGPNTVSGVDLPGGVISRWSRVWYVDVTDAGANAGVVELCFAFGDSGIGTLPVGNHQLLYRPGTSGAFSALGPAGMIQGDRVLFAVDAALLADGCYTLGSDSAPPPTATPAPTMTPAPTATPTPTAAPCCPGDADNSGSFVDANDFIAVQAHFGADNGVGGLGDANCSGSFVDANDFIAVQAAFGADCTP